MKPQYEFKNRCAEHLADPPTLHFVAGYAYPRTDADLMTAYNNLRKMRDDSGGIEEWLRFDTLCQEQADELVASLGRAIGPVSLRRSP